MNAPDPVPLNVAARRLRVPLKWLRAECDAGRIPHLRAGKQVLVDLETVRKVLSERAVKGVQRG